MTENFLQKLEEKVLALLTELESQRSELNQLRQENSHLKAEKVNHSKKLQSLVALLESMDMNTPSHPILNDADIVHHVEEYSSN